MKVRNGFVYCLFLVVIVIHSAQANDKQASEALQIALAGGLDDMRDFTDEELGLTWKQKEQSHGSLGARSAMLAGTAAGVYAPPPGFSKGSATTMQGLGVFLSLLSTRPKESLFQYQVWMPKSEASSAEAAREKLREYLLKAYQKALPEHQVELLQSMMKILMQVRQI